jgi:hypothetical protein
MPRFIEINRPSFTIGLLFDYINFINSPTMKNRLIMLVCSLIAGSFLSPTPTLAQSTDADFLISQKQVGFIEKGMSIKQALAQVPQSQIRRVKSTGEFSDEMVTEYEIYDEDEKLLLTISSEAGKDMDAPVNIIQIHDSRFQSERRIGLGSTYGQLYSQHKIASHQPDQQYIIALADRLNASFFIAKSQLEDGWWDEEKKYVIRRKIPESSTFSKLIIRWD